MKKNIIFMIINMNVGGTEKALLNMLSEIPKDKYSITILMLEKYGGFLNSIPREVHIKYFEEYEEIKDILNEPPHIIFLNLLREGKIIRGSRIMLLHLLTKFIKDRSLFFKYVLREYPIVEGEYDIAVAYAGPMDFISYFVINNIKAKKKFQWIHFDVTKITFNQIFSDKLYKKFDHIFVVSNEAKYKLLSIIPSIKKKTEVCPNIVSAKLIQNEAKEGKRFNDNFLGIRILTVGRLTNEKGQDFAIKVLARLINEGYKVRWYCVGEGGARKEYEKLITEYGLERDFILLGELSNPYGYMATCDIYVQPSRYEGFCITLAEAKCLHKAIVTTNFTGAKEQIKNRETGMIVNISESDIYEGVKSLIDNRSLCEVFSGNLANENFDKTLELKRNYEFF
ncbi:glycosyl transferase [Bacillus mycoides]|uniref:glycosyltransferase n=1 Tax=Bacillus TaxID=1386 RepID=UPI000994669C|nr:glycosyltransferase [Bacillus mycoides]OOR00213.1 glycosyl transferase [Bacillus mycoides]OOR64486.1 glycosyl transferase [Bacillus mycoides]HDR7586982.1 glycosyltransferase [Bacillus mycoides]